LTRSVVGQVLRLDVFVLLILDNLEILGRHSTDLSRFAAGRRMLVVPLDRVAERVLPGDDRKDVTGG